MHITSSQFKEAALLEAWKRGATHNTNESFHNIVWTMARKTQFCSLTTLRIALNLAVAKYNFGFLSGLSRCFVAITGLEVVSSRIISSYTGLDADRGWSIVLGGLEKFKTRGGNICCA